MSSSVKNIFKMNFNLDDVKSFVSSKGWKIDNEDANSFLVSAPNRNKLKAIISNFDDDEFRYQTDGLLNLLSTFERCEISSTVEEFKTFLEGNISPFQSAIKLRFGVDQKQDALKLSELENVIRTARLTLAYSAETELGKASSGKNKLDPQAQKLAANYYFEHTQKGSFVVVIRSPPTNTQISLFEEDTTSFSIEDRAIARVAKGINQVLLGNIDLKNPNEVLHIADKGLTAKMATHLSNLFTTTDYSNSSIVFNVKDDLKSQYEIKELNFKIGQPEAKKLQDFANSISVTMDQTLTVHVQIIHLDSDDVNQEAFVHDIKVKSLETSGPTMNQKFSVTLDKNQYTTLGQKHLKGIPVVLTGVFTLRPGYVKLKELISIK